MSSREDLQQRFNKANLSKHNNLLTQTRVFQELIMFMDYKIRNQIKTFTLLSLCGGERTKFMIDIYFQKAFTNLNLVEKVELYEKTIQYAIQIQNIQNQIKQSVIDINVEEDSDSVIMKREAMRFRVQVEKGFRSWNQIYLQIDGFKVSSEEMQFDLRNYIVRRSKKTDKQCYVLEAIHQSEPDVLRFCFLTNNDFKKYLPIIMELINKGYKQMIKRMYNIQIKNNSTLTKPIPFKDKTLLINSNSKNFLVEQQNHIPQCPEISHIVEEVLKQPEQQNLSLELNQIIANDNQKFQQMQQEKKLKKHKQPEQVFHKNIFSVIFPTFDLSHLEHFEQYKVASTNELVNCAIFQSSSNPFVFKLQILLQLSPILALQALTNLPLFKHWHPQVIQGQIKLSISSQNCAICYQTHRAYSQWYRQRDFLFLRHIFKIDQDYFIADRSIENTNFVPLETIHRGKIVYQIIKISPSNSGSKLIIQCHFQHGGLLNRVHANDLSNRYLCGFQKMQAYFKKKDFQNKLKKYFNSEWAVKQMPTLQNFRHLKSKQSVQLHDSQFNDQKVSKIDEQDVFFSIKEDQDDDFQRKSVHQINQKELQEKKIEHLPNVPSRIQTNEEGLVILPKQYLKVRHPTGIINSTQKKKIDPVFSDYLLKDVWKYEDDGGLMLINKKLMAAQDSVLSFIMSTLKKNIFSGKGGLNISLPVTIFNSDSNLSRFCVAMGNAPQFVEQAAQLTDPIQRMKLCMIFGLTNSLLFVDMEKPFNPILGETYQCYIAGCPVYAEQISHHPPISALLMYGRGYRIQATLQATANIHLNSADGVNIGWYRIIFDDGQEICFQTPPAQFSGFAIGDRKFFFTKKGYYFDMGNNLFAQMHFQDNSGLFSGKKWRYKDQVEAQILSVKSDFLSKFVSAFTEKKHLPGSSDILDRHGKLQGRWTHSLSWNGAKVYSIHDNLPYEVIQYQYPLPSNSKYREDLYYRKNNDLARSQIEKQRLENVQRGDRKQRAKYTGNKH